MTFFLGCDLDDAISTGSIENKKTKIGQLPTTSNNSKRKKSRSSHSKLIHVVTRKLGTEKESLAETSHHLLVESRNLRYGQKSTIHSLDYSLHRHGWTLIQLCLNTIAKHLLLFMNGSPLNTTLFIQKMSLIPDPLIHQLFQMARSYYPNHLNSMVLSGLFMREHCQELDLDDLSGVKPGLIRQLGNKRFIHLKRLRLNHLDIPDTVLAKTIPHLISLEELDFRGCTKIRNKTMTALAKYRGSHMKRVNASNSVKFCYFMLFYFIFLYFPLLVYILID